MALALAVSLLGADVVAAQTPRKSRDAEKNEPDRKAAPRTDVSDKTQPVTVDADKMERFGKEGLVVFTGSVVARQNSSVQYADRMEVYFDERNDRVVRTVSTGSVKIVTRDCKTGTAKRAEYFDLEQRLVLSGGARVWEDENLVTGDTITIYLSQDRSVVEGSRVRGIFYPRESQKDGAAAPKKDATKPACAN